MHLYEIWPFPAMLKILKNFINFWGFLNRILKFNRVTSNIIFYVLKFVWNLPYYLFETSAWTNTLMNKQIYRWSPFQFCDFWIPHNSKGVNSSEVRYQKVTRLSKFPTCKAWWWTKICWKEVLLCSTVHINLLLLQFLYCSIK